MAANFTRLSSRPKPSLLAINNLARSLEVYRDDIALDAADWLEIAVSDLREAATARRGNRPRTFRRALADAMIEGYGAVRPVLTGESLNLADAVTRTQVQGALGLLSVSELLLTDDFWLSADAVAVEGDDMGDRWRVGMDFTTPGHPRLHYPTDEMNTLLGDVEGSETVWYRADTGLLLERQAPAWPAAGHGVHTAPPTPLTPYLPNRRTA